MSVASQPMTTEEFLALPDDGVDRELIRGELREKPMTTRGRPHCRVTSNLSYLIGKWVREQPEPRGGLYDGEIRIRLRRDPDTIVGADLVYVSPEAEAQADEDDLIVEGPPLLVIEVTSPSDTAEDMDLKRRAYLDAGVPIVWQVDPMTRTVTIYRPDRLPEMANLAQELTAEPHLPGFRVPVAEVFAH
jgi:Uma2 family endonuclease